MADQSSDVASTLNELERKLRALERDLHQGAAESPPAPEPPDQFAGVNSEQLIEEARRQLDALRAELEELGREREQIALATEELLKTYPQQPTYPSVPSAGPIPQPFVPEHTVQQGAVTIDAGFFRDVTSLSVFEQSIARVPGVVGVNVRALDQGRATIDVQLPHPIALGAELARYAPIRFTVTGAGPQHLMLAISS